MLTKAGKSHAKGNKKTPEQTNGVILASSAFSASSLIPVGNQSLIPTGRSTLVRLPKLQYLSFREFVNLFSERFFSLQTPASNHRSHHLLDSQLFPSVHTQGTSSPFLAMPPSVPGGRSQAWAACLLLRLQESISRRDPSTALELGPRQSHLSSGQPC